MPDDQTPAPILSMELRDWRFADGADDELTGKQREPWTLEARPAGWGGLSLVFKGPDGAERSVNVEIDKGNVSLTLFGEHEEAIAIAKLSADGVTALAGQVAPHAEAGVRITRDGIEHGVDQAEASFAEETSDPKI